MTVPTHSFADGCPECLGELPVMPSKVVPLTPPHVRAFYRCPSCGHGWRTGWNAEYVIGRPEVNGGAA